MLLSAKLTESFSKQGFARAKRCLKSNLKYHENESTPYGFSLFFVQIRQSSFYDVAIEKYAAKPNKKLTLQQMLTFGQTVSGDNRESAIIKSSRFVQSELPVRLAKRLLDLQFLPHIFVTNPHIRKVYDAYRRAFFAIYEFPKVESFEENQKFTKLLTQLMDEQTPLISDLAYGVKECASRPLISSKLDLDSFLDNMLRSRISRRVLAEQHICLQLERKNYIGVIHTELSISERVQKAVLQCEEICQSIFGIFPKFSICGDIETKFAYIPAHLDYMLFEILKNSSRAVIERYLYQKKPFNQIKSINFSDFSLIVIKICKGVRDVTIKISDEGGGIDDEKKEMVWKYGYSTVQENLGIGEENKNKKNGFEFDYGDSNQVKDPMAGLGFGLPLSRLHAQYFGGNLEMVSIAGYGTDVYLRIHRLGIEEETLEI